MTNWAVARPIQKSKLLTFWIDFINEITAPRGKKTVPRSNVTLAAFLFPICINPFAAIQKAAIINKINAINR
jgi:hypothetical protein